MIGHIQRGGNPSCRDRVYASAMGARAVDLLLKGQTNRVVAYKNGEFTDFDIDYALQMTKDIDEHLYSMNKTPFTDNWYGYRKRTHRPSGL